MTSSAHASRWTECSESCEGGTQSRLSGAQQVGENSVARRKVKSFAEHGGKP